ncbi:hypothetical protein [Rubrimonas sp.]|uniref:hypothetical protein n=1 Tax=Rubrimonas sp. TaxID=2036015 RepID=UPI002FDE70A1
MAEIARKPYTVRLSDEDLALLPPGENVGESLRKFIADNAALGDRWDAILERLDAVKAALDGVKSRENQTTTLPENALEHDHGGASVALEMILYNLRALYSGLLRTEAVATAALYGIVDADATSEALEKHLKTRFDGHMSKLWPLFVAENDRGLKSLRGDPSAARSGADADDETAHGDVGGDDPQGAETAA